MFINHTLFDTVVKKIIRNFFFPKLFVKISTHSDKKSNFNRVFTAFEDFLPGESMTFYMSWGIFCQRSVLIEPK